MALGLLYFTPYLNTSLRSHKSKTDILEDFKFSLFFLYACQRHLISIKAILWYRKIFWYCLAHHFDALQLNRRRPTTIFWLRSPYKYWDLLCVTLFFPSPAFVITTSYRKKHDFIELQKYFLFLESENFRWYSITIFTPFPWNKNDYISKIEIFNNYFFNKEPWALICCTQSVRIKIYQVFVS